MASRVSGNVDLIEELQLRRWARQHYLPPAQRPAFWHPIVLEEMAFRDQEDAQRAAAETETWGPFVPLAPLEWFDLHAAHGRVQKPQTRKSFSAMSKAHRQVIWEDEPIAGF